MGITVACKGSGAEVEVLGSVGTTIGTGRTSSDLVVTSLVSVAATDGRTDFATRALRLVRCTGFTPAALCLLRSCILAGEWTERCRMWWEICVRGNGHEHFAI